VREEALLYYGQMDKFLTPKLLSKVPTVDATLILTRDEWPPYPIISSQRRGKEGSSKGLKENRGQKE